MNFPQLWMSMSGVVPDMRQRPPRGEESLETQFFRDWNGRRGERHGTAILKTPKDGNLGAALNAAMEAIEAAFPPLAGQLPKDYGRFEGSARAMVSECCPEPPIIDATINPPTSVPKRNGGDGPDWMAWEEAIA
jgi:hypothetical protein